MSPRLLVLGVVLGVVVVVGLVSAVAPEVASAQAEDSPPPAAVTAVQTDNQYEHVVRSDLDRLPTAEPDGDGRFPMEVRGGYGQGIWFGELTDAFALQLRARAQLRIILDAPDGQETGVGAEVRRLRLVIGGHVLRHLMTYYVQLGFSAQDLDPSEQVPLRDAFLTFHLHPAFNLRVGQMKVPFDRQRVTSSSALQFVDRAELVRELNLDRDIGIQLYSMDVLDAGGVLSYQLGIFAGEGRNQLSPDPGLLYVGRVQLASRGSFSDFSEGDLEGGPPRIALAAAVGYNHRAQRVDSTSGAFYQSGHTDFVHATTDVVVKAYGFSLLLEALLRDAIQTTIEGDPASGWGLLAQAGYLFPHGVELVGRAGYERPLAPSSVVESTELGGGANWYVIDHDLKLQVEYRATLYPGGAVDQLGRAQVQLYF